MNLHTSGSRLKHLEPRSKFMRMPEKLWGEMGGTMSSWTQWKQVRRLLCCTDRKTKRNHWWQNPRIFEGKPGGKQREREGGKSKRRKCRKKTMTFVTESNSSQEQRTQTEALWERIFSAHTQFLLFEFTTCVCSFFDGRAVGLSMCASICVMFRFAVCVCVFWCYLGMGFWRAAAWCHTWWSSWSTSSTRKATMSWCFKSNIEVILVLRCYKDITKRVTAFGESW